MSERSARADATNGQAANEVGDSDNEADSEDVVGGELSILPRNGVTSDVRDNWTELVLQDDGNDDAVNSDSLAENDGNQVLGNNALHLDSGAHNGDTSSEDTPADTQLVMHSCGRKYTYQAAPAMEAPSTIDRPMKAQKLGSMQ